MDSTQKKINAKNDETSMTQQTAHIASAFKFCTPPNSTTLGSTPRESGEVQGRLQSCMARRKRKLPLTTSPLSHKHISPCIEAFTVQGSNLGAAILGGNEVGKVLVGTVPDQRGRGGQANFGGKVQSAEKT